MIDKIDQIDIKDFAMKNRVVATLLSAIIPGAGQIYNGEVLKGIILLILAFVSAVLMAILIGYLLYFPLWIYGMIDAVIVADKINKGKMAKPSDKSHIHKVLSPQYVYKKVLKEKRLLDNNITNEDEFLRRITSIISEITTGSISCLPEDFILELHKLDGDHNILTKENFALLKKNLLN